MKNKTLLYAAALFLVIFSVWWYSPKQYSKTLEGIYFRSDNSKLEEKVILHIDGKLQRRISGTFTIEGTVVFEGDNLPILPEYQEESFSLHYDSRYAQGSVIHSGFNVNGSITPYIYNPGILYAEPHFKRFAIFIYPGDHNDKQRSWSLEDSLVIAAPAGNRAEAVELANEMFHMRGLDRDLFSDKGAATVKELSAPIWAKQAVLPF